MVVLAESIHPATGERKLDVVVGPYWPMMLCVTYPLIFIVTFLVGRSTWGNQHIAVSVVWLLASLSLPLCLAGVACRDPGILPRYSAQPEASWRWNSQALTYRPPGSIYDSECGVVIEEFDHVCPWTGTAIGAKNMTAFKLFVSGICTMIVVDVILCAGVLAFTEQ
jgi:hypothetical protein